MIKEKTLKIVGMAVITGTVIYGALIYAFWFYGVLRLPQIDCKIKDTLLFVFLLLGLVTFFLAYFIRGRVWNIRKKTIDSQDSFYSVFFAGVILELSLLESIAVMGLTAFILTGNVGFSLVLVVASLLSQIIGYTQGYNIEHKKMQFPQFFSKG
ncbi:MAG: hypothetical protein PHW54_07490 [Candidatus Omnitrophica bacterium]|nr:hypothetical protein [Candidatus Omnitrophota bacterium]